jgi:hypothetical protein
MTNPFGSTIDVEAASVIVGAFWPAAIREDRKALEHLVTPALTDVVADPVAFPRRIGLTPGPGCIWAPLSWRASLAMVRCGSSRCLSRRGGPW